MKAEGFDIEKVLKPRIRPKGKASRGLKAERTQLREHFKPGDNAAIGP